MKRFKKDKVIKILNRLKDYTLNAHEEAVYNYDTPGEFYESYEMYQDMIYTNGLIENLGTCINDLKNA